MIKPKFLFAPDEETSTLYILHREFPACLIEVIHTIPTTFRIVDLYDEIDHDELIKHPFLEEAKKFYKEKTSDSLDLN